MNMPTQFKARSNFEWGYSLACLVILKEAKTIGLVMDKKYIRYGCFWVLSAWVITLPCDRHELTNVIDDVGLRELIEIMSIEEKTLY